MEEVMSDSGLNAENISFATNIARKFSRRFNYYVDPAELVSIALGALCDASLRYQAELGASFRTYAYLRIRGAILDEVRKQQRRSQREILCSDGLEDIAPLNDGQFTLTPETLLEQRAESRQLRSLVQLLKCPKERRVIELIYFETYTSGEVAQMLGKSKSWVSRYHQNALYSLQTSLRRGTGNAYSI
jgi:RNA polymerase sigma factor (sigma-70 family)